MVKKTDYEKRIEAIYNKLSKDEKFGLRSHLISSGLRERHRLTEQELKDLVSYFWKIEDKKNAD